ncbi:MAG: glycosyltransferase family 2 protein [Candidatus Magasanikbacteria bacterium]|nr:glycosyltransferase family 2 protein [Candidatus Magasanikbacteria bacterium]
MYTIVIPVFNEEKRIPKNINTIFSYFKTQEVKTEIIFVNDGSIDSTQKILEEYRKVYDFKLVEYKENRGKGYAIKQGVHHATGEWIIFFDIDLATPLSEFTHLLKFKDDADQIIVGSRRLGGSQIEKSESKLRVFLGQGFTRLSNILVPGIKDFTCGFKCFRADVAQKIFSKACIDRWGFDTELLYIAKLFGIPVRQMPVVWSHDFDSRVKVYKAVLQTLKELGQMKWNQMRGIYS